MAKITGPIGPRRSIALTLKQQREESGRTLTDVATDLLISTSKLSRLENAQGKPQLRDIRDLIRYYGIEGTPLDKQLRQWVAAAERPVWWDDYGDEIVGGLAAHLAYEADATIERVYTLPFVPALLQTVDYTRAIFKNIEARSAHFARASFEDTEASSEDEIPELIEIRKRRQEVLTHRDGLDPLKLVAVMHESALHQSVGSPKILRDQLDALLDRSTAPNVSLHVLPFAASPVFTMTCMYAYFEYEGDNNLEQDVVHIETHAGFASIETPERVADYRKWHDALVRASLPEDESRDLIRSILDDMPGGR